MPGRYAISSPPGAMALNSAPKPMILAHSYALPTLPAGRWCRTRESLYAAQVALDAIATDLEAYVRPRGAEHGPFCEGHVRAEQSELTRAAPTDAFHLGWDVQSSGYMHAPFADVQEQAVTAWVGALARAIVAEYGLVPLPPVIGQRSDKGKGCPFPGSGMDLAGDLTAWAAQSVFSLDAQLELHAQDLAVGPNSGRRWAAKQITRRQPRVRTAPVMVMVNGELTAVGEVDALFPKIRQAWMMPYPLNVKLSPINDAWQALIGKVAKEAESRGEWSWAHEFKHTQASLDYFFADPAVRFASDFNKYDLTITVAAVRAAFRAILQIFRLPAGFADELDQVITRLSGIAIYGHGVRLGTVLVYAAEAMRKQSLESGLLLTSLLGTLVTFSVMNATLLGDLPQHTIDEMVLRWVRTGKAPWGRRKIQSDDVAGATHANPLELGMSATIEDWLVFLKEGKRALKGPRFKLIGPTATKLVIEEHGGRGSFVPHPLDFTLPEVKGLGALVNKMLATASIAARCEQVLLGVAPLVTRVFDGLIASMKADDLMNRMWGYIVGFPRFTDYIRWALARPAAAIEHAAKVSKEVAKHNLSGTTASIVAEAFAAWGGERLAYADPGAMKAVEQATQAVTVYANTAGLLGAGRVPVYVGRGTIKLKKENVPSTETLLERHGVSKRIAAPDQVAARLSPTLIHEQEADEH